MSADSMLALNTYDPASAAVADPTIRGLIERRQRIFGAAVPLFYEDPVHITRAEGVWLYDHEGRAYLDAYNNVPSVGHCHPRVVDAVARQAAQLNTHTRYLSEVVYAYAERLLATFPEALSNLLFTSSGTESVDLALRMARYHTGGAGFIVTRFAYHGHSTAVAEITPAFGPGVPLGVHVRTVPAPRRVEAARTYPSPSPPASSRPSPTCAGTASASPARSSIRSFPATGCTPTRPASCARRPRPCGAMAASTSPTRCSQASAAPAPACGASVATASRPTWW